MYSKDLFLERAQLALLDGGVAFASLVSAAYVLLLRYQGLYSIRCGRFAEAMRVLRAATLGTMAALAITFFYRGYSYSRATVLIFYALSIVLLVLSRNLYRGYRRAVRAHPAAARRVLIVGFGRVGDHLGRELLEQPTYYDLRGFLDDDPRKAGVGIEDRRVLGTTADLERTVREQRVDEVIVAMPSAPRAGVLDLLGRCLRLRVRFKVVPDLYDLMLD